MAKSDLKANGLLERFNLQEAIINSWEENLTLAPPAAALENISGSAIKLGQSSPKIFFERFSKSLIISCELKHTSGSFRYE